MNLLPTSSRGRTDQRHRSALWRASRPPFSGEERQPTRPDQPILTRHTDNPGTTPTTAPTTLPGWLDRRAGGGFAGRVRHQPHPDLEEPACPARLCISRSPSTTATAPARSTRRPSAGRSCRCPTWATRSFPLVPATRRPARPSLGSSTAACSSAMTASRAQNIVIDVPDIEAALKAVGRGRRQHSQRTDGRGRDGLRGVLQGQRGQRGRPLAERLSISLRRANARGPPRSPGHPDVGCLLLVRCSVGSLDLHEPPVAGRTPGRPRCSRTPRARSRRGEAT